MGHGLTSETSTVSSSSGVSNTCWVSVAVIVGILIFILIINDLFLRKQMKCKKTQRNVRFNDEDDDQYEQANTVKKSSCSLNH
jgi:uncharacterized membrane protein YciS (DUF1049 family)